MDIESFAQCLTYAQQTTKPESDQLIQGAIALAGVALGFFLNQAREAFKDKGAIKNKKMCISEDVHRLRHLSERAAGDIASALLELVGGKTPTSHRMPPSFRAPLLESYFSEIAHTYSVDDRYFLKELGHLTPRLDVLLRDFVEVDGRWKFSIVGAELINAIAYCVGVCDRVLGDPPRKTPEEVLANMEIDALAIDAFRAVMNNIANNDEVLGLKRKAP